MGHRPRTTKIKPLTANSQLTTYDLGTANCQLTTDDFKLTGDRQLTTLCLPLSAVYLELTTDNCHLKTSNLALTDS